MYKKAFTLVELLIASSIFVIVILTVYSAFYSGISGYRNIEDTIDAYQTARMVLGRIDLDLRNSFVYSNDAARFSGQQNEISFFTLIDRFSEDEILRQYAFVSYKIEDKKLMRLCRTGREALNETSEIQPEEMAANIEEMAFSYFYFDLADNELKEKASWDDAKNLPMAVRMSLTIKRKIAQSFQRTIYLPPVR